MTSPLRKRTRAGTRRESENVILLDVNEIDDEKRQDRRSETEREHVTDIVSRNTCSRLRRRGDWLVRRLSLGFSVFGGWWVGVHAISLTSVRCVL
jgi:hypothetical protein